MLTGYPLSKEDPNQLVPPKTSRMLRVAAKMSISLFMICSPYLYLYVTLQFLMINP
jgi:hypothetical protein